MTRTGIGQDSHAFEEKAGKPLLLGGVLFEWEKGLKGNSDSDVVLHALCNAISGVTGVNVLGKTTDEMCQQGIVDSTLYVKKALERLGEWKVVHTSISIEAKTPKFASHIDAMRLRIAQILNIEADAVGITATSGEELTSFGQGKGIQALALITVEK